MNSITVSPGIPAENMTIVLLACIPVIIAVLYIIFSNKIKSEDIEEASL